MSESAFGLNQIGLELLLAGKIVCHFTLEHSKYSLDSKGLGIDYSLNVVLAHLKAELLQRFAVKSLPVVEFLLDRMSLRVVMKLDDLRNEVMDHLSQ